MITWITPSSPSEIRKYSGPPPSTTPIVVEPGVPSIKIPPATKDINGKPMTERFKPFNDVNALTYGLIAKYGRVIDGISGTEVAIPFEYNPSITEGGASAQYTAIQVINRINTLQAYTGTDSYTLTLNTKYFALSDEDDKPTTGPDGPFTSMMQYFSIQQLKAIEYKYRSLSYPDYDSTTNDDMGSFYKPPIVRIKMGGTTESENFMFTKPVKSGDQTVYRTRTFVVSALTIDKKTEDNPWHLNKDGDVDTTMGFEVSMNLLEVDNDYFADGGFSGFMSFFNSDTLKGRVL